VKVPCGIRIICFERAGLGESGCLRVQPEKGGILHLRLNTGGRPIANKYRDGKMKQTLKRVSKQLEIVEMEAISPGEESAPGLRERREDKSFCQSTDRVQRLARVGRVQEAEWRGGGCRRCKSNESNHGHSEEGTRPTREDERQEFAPCEWKGGMVLEEA